jgi:tRNA A37 threonylcarbamoyladenosine synthetase subunit TsaC/SUA5/YrdC
MNRNKIYLAQTDTTVGFLSQDSKRLSQIKKRDANKPFLIEVDSLKRLKEFTRVPNGYKNMVRRAKKVTFVFPKGIAVRVVKDEEHLKFLKKFGWMYSTSANLSQKRYDDDFALANADIVVRDRRGFFEGKPSKIIKIGQKSSKRLR